MGLIKYIIFIIVLVAHDENFGIFFRANHMVHIAVTLLISFSLLETGYITAKQFQFNIYKSQRDFLISRMCRIYLPSVVVVLVTAIFMTNSALFVHSQHTVFYEISHLDLSSKIVYVVSHLFILILPLMFFKYDPALHKFVYTFFFDDNSISAIGISITPHLWIILPDIIGMFLVAFLVYKQHYKIGLALFFLGILLQFFLMHEIIVNNLDKMWIFQNPVSELLFFFSGFLFGIKNFSFAEKTNKLFSVAIGYFLIFSVALLVAKEFDHYYLPFIFYTLCLFTMSLACDFLWKTFAFHKTDMKIRDMASHLYFWQFLLLSLIYNSFTISMLGSVFVTLFIIVTTAFIGVNFEKLNKKLIRFLISESPTK